MSAENVYPQQKELSLDLRNVTISKVISEIEKTSDYVFLITDEAQLELNKKTSIRANKESIRHILESILKDTNLGYSVVERQVSIYKDTDSNASEKPVTVTEEIAQQKKSITGRVTDNEGVPIIGANIVEVGTTNGTVTDVDGNFTLSVEPTATIRISYIGYLEQSINTEGQSVFNITLLEDTQSLEELVVIGYGTVRKSDLTGAVSSVKAEELQSTPITSIDQGLGGRAAGVMVTQTSGMPGAVASIRVRGSSSLQGGNEPLYVIDGFPVYNGSGFGNTGGNARYSGLSTINPSDIESIEILKDASATSIYGARAANGVVLITTKSGRRGTDIITFDATYGVQNVVKKIDVMNALEYAELSNEAYMNDGLAPPYNEAEMQKIRQNPKGTDWQDEVFRTAPTQNYQLTFSGGDQKMIYSVSVNYINQEGIIRSSDFERYSGRINLDRNVLDNLRLGTNLTMSKTISNAVRTDAGGREGVASSAMKFNPILPVFIDEKLKIYTPVNSPGIVYANPVATADEMIRENQAVRLLGNIFAEWEIIPDLKAKVSFGTDLFNTKFNTYIPSNIYESGGVASATINGDYTTNWLNENTLSWNKEINEDHRISLLGGITFQQNHYEGVTASSQDYVNDVLKYNSLQAGATYNQPSSSNTDWSLISYLGRANYNFKERYLFSLSARVDGSSRFGTNNKYAFFPSGAFAWRLSEEDFIQDLGFFDNLKLRTSYGFTGNQEIGLYNSLPTLTSTTYTIGRALVTGFYPNKIPNPDLKWEKTSQLNVGLDIGLLNNRFRITSDYYYKKTTDLIYDVGVPFVSGFSTSLQNIGSVENQGWELAFESDNLTGQFEWTTNFNISFNRNKILELGGEDYKDVGEGDGHLKTGSVHRLIVDEPIGLFYGYVFDGIFQNQAELDAGPKSPTNWVGGRRYADLSGPEGVPDGVVNATYDRTIIGDPNPDFFGGLTNTFYYKGFELNLFLQYSYGNDIFNYNAIELELPSGGQNVYADLVNRWKPDNASNQYPVATTNRSAVFSSAYIEDGSYLKVKTLTLAYHFPELKTRHLSGLKLYVTGNNLLTFTNYRGYDPEVSYQGATNLELGEDFGGYPQARTFLFGVSFNIK
jgi:TonB-linked SusC/RagA family outer membrane protein